LIEYREPSENEIRKEAGMAFDDPAVLRPQVLLHSCCGPCSTAVVERLSPRFKITIYYCNSNIDDEAEYQRRLAAQKEYVTRYNASVRMNEPLSLVQAIYAPAAFLKLAQGAEDSPEGGERCRRCISDRLEKTAAFAAINGYEYFSTTLSASRYKSYEMIAELGKALALRYSLSFIDDNFKRGGGEQRAVLLAKSYGLYRQNYCGCRFSKR
jgi:predicted adenine nucleotide alpha hydrolase (AANH) superfamily ATPase